MPSIGAAYSDREIRNAIEGTQVAGGAGYISTLSEGEIPTEADADVTVNNDDDLVSEAETGSGRLIWVEDDAVIDMTGRKVESQNMIAGNRGQDGADGPLIHCDNHGETSSAYGGVADGYDHNGVFLFSGSGGLWGLRLRGPTHDYWDDDAHPGYLPYRVDPSYAYWFSRCVSLRSDDAEVGNCEIYGWSTQAIYVGTRSTGWDPHIHHCDLHDNMQTAYGYHVMAAHGAPTIEWCYLNAHRHAINGSGLDGAGWIVQYNVFGPSTSQHEIDMHSRSNNSTGTTSNYSNGGYYGNAGGAPMICRYNTFTNTHIISDANFQENNMTRAVSIRGVPYPRTGDVVEIYGNRFEHPDDIGPRPSPGHQLREDQYTGAVTQQWRRGSGQTFNFENQLVADDVTPNFHVYDNQVNGSTSTYDPDYGVPGLNLRDDRPTSRYEVLVLDSDTSEGVSNAEIRIWDSDGEWIRTTDSTGETVFSALPHRQFSAEISAEDYELLEASLSISGDASETYELSPTAPEQPDTAILAYEVSDYDEGEPVEGATISLWGR